MAHRLHAQLRWRAARRGAERGAALGEPDRARLPAQAPALFVAIAVFYGSHMRGRNQGLPIYCVATDERGLWTSEPTTFVERSAYIYKPQ